jgi:hypothetical protein
MAYWPRPRWCAVSKRVGEYVPLSATYAEDDAILCLSPLAELLYVRSLSLAAKLHSDGYLTEAQVTHLAARRLGSDQKVRKLVDELVTGGLWLAESGGYVIRGWLKWNRSSEDLGRERAKDRDRKRTDRHAKAGEEPFDSPGEQSHVPTESVTCPPGQVTDIAGTDAGIQPESEGSPPSRAPARGGARRAVSTKDRSYSNGTARHGTLPDMPDDPPETPSARANRLARVYTDEVRVSNFPAIAKIVRKAVDADVADEAIIAGLKKLIAENRGLTTETLRVAIYGQPKEQSTGDERAAGNVESGLRVQAFIDQNGGAA